MKKINLPIIGIYYEYFKYLILNRSTWVVIIILLLLSIPFFLFFLFNNYFNILQNTIKITNFGNMIGLFSLLIGITTIIYPLINLIVFKEEINNNKNKKKLAEIYLKFMKINLLTIITTIFLVVLLNSFLIGQNNSVIFKIINTELNIFIWTNLALLLHDTNKIVISLSR